MCDKGSYEHYKKPVPFKKAFNKKAGNNWLKTSCILLVTLFLVTIKTFAGVEVIPAGSKIINMGVSPQTIANGLKPYGLVYALLQNNTPVKWVINPNKIKDGIDFTHNGVSYKGSVFIVSAELVTSTVNSIIASWASQGVVVNTSVSPFTANVAYNLNTAPRWVVDHGQTIIAGKYFNDAGIPNSAWISKAPSQLTNCDDIYVLPHGDITWAEHKNLYYWNQTYKGNIWVGCYAASGMENTYGPDITSPGITRRMNFLMNDGSGLGKSALPFGGHTGGTPPYNLLNPTHPVMQFMGSTDKAHTNGPEQIYLPNKSAGWRSSTYIGSFDPSQRDIPGNSNGPAAVIAFGRAFGDATRGWVMYEAGHTLDGNTSDNVAAERAFFNFCLINIREKQPFVTASGIPITTYSNTVSNLTAVATSQNINPTFTYQWISSCGGTFSNPTSATTTFTAPNVASQTLCTITCLVTDNCGRKVFDTRGVTILPAPRAPIPANDVVTMQSCSYTSTINALANDTDPDGGALTLTLVGNGAKGTFTNTGNGIITYTPGSYYQGSDQVQYQICNPKGMCSTATITVNVNALDGNGCAPDQYYGIASVISAVRATLTAGGSPIGLSNSLNEADGAVGDATTYTEFNNNNQTVIYSLSSAIPQTGTLYFYVDGNKPFTVTQSTDSVNFTNSTTFTINSTEDFLAANAKAYTVNAGTKFIKLTFTGLSTTSIVQLDAMEYNIMGCVSAAPRANDDVAQTLEDIPVTIDVVSNDDDPQNLNLVPSGITKQPLYGKVSINTNNTITYLNYKDQIGSGVDSFSYRVCNTKGLCATATVVISFVADNCAAGQYKPYTFTAPTTITINPSQDTYLNEGATATNYGTASEVRVLGKSGARERAYMQFNLSSIPSNAIIDSALFSLYETANAGGENVSVYRITRAWTETGATWTKADAATNWTFAGGDGSNTVWATTNVGTTNSVYKNWNIKSLVQNWVNGTYSNLGFALVRNPEGGTGTFKEMKFSSREAANKPKLYITYRVPGTCTAIPLRDPLAMQDSAITNSVTPVNMSVADNDYDYNNTGLSVNRLSLTSTKGGTINRNGNILTYIPPATTPAYNGIDSFKYKVTSSGLSDSAYVIVNVTDAAPYANADTYSLQSNTSTTPNSVTANVLSNDYDPEGSSLTGLAITLSPKYGTATVTGSSITYTPYQNYVGNDTLIYQVSQAAGTSCSILSDTALVIFTVTNRAPVSYADSTILNACEVVTLSPLTNDIDPEEGSMTIQILSQPSIGSVVLTNNNTQLIYTPPSGVNNVSTTFTYQACDNGSPSLCGNTVTYKISIRVPPAINNPPIANRDTFKVNRNAILYADVLTNDVEPDGQDFAMPVIVTSPTRGSAIVLPNNLIQYTPSAAYFGLDSFQYRVYDTIVQVGGCVTIPQTSATAWAFIIIQDVPVADWDKTRTMKGQAATINVLSNDVFGYYGPGTGTITVTTQPKNGTASVLNNGSINQNNNTVRYTPNSTFTGLDSLIYQVSDAQGSTDTAMVYIWVVPDSDGDGVADDIDIDDDNDGIPDYVESCGAGTTSWSCTPNNSDPSSDDDNDGIVNYKDADWATLNTAVCAGFLDSDGDGIPNYLDRDSDNDGIADVIEALGVDANGDGIIDNFCDTDGDGLSQNVDANNTGAAGSGQGLGLPDFDADGVPNYLDLDSDNDGIPDIVESYGLDTNNDGRVDTFMDNDGDGWANFYDGDANGDGVVENLNRVLVLSGPDPNYINCASPGTGRPVCYAHRGNGDNSGLPNFLDLDSDGDGITDATESGITTVSYLRGMVTTCSFVDGWCSTIKAMPALNLRNTDNVGRADLYDIDSDNDGITDNVEGQPTGSYVVPTDADTDGDGLADVYDIYNGIGGNGITPYDHDNDGTPDFRDLDSDNDGAPDRNEGDKANEGMPQIVIDESGDADGDGLMDYFDTYDLLTQNCSTVYRNIGMGNMGPAGDYHGPTPSGSNVQLVKSTAIAIDRDWRNNATLPLQVINFSASLANNTVALAWKAENEQQVNYYTLERSLNGISYDDVVTVKSLNQSASNYNYDDNIKGLSAASVYYRIKQVNKNGEIAYTRVISFNLTKTVSSKLSIYPIPVADVLNINIYTTLKQVAMLAITDASGKVLIQKSVALEKGDNKVLMPEISKVSKGLFVIRAILAEATITEKGIKQ